MAQIATITVETAGGPVDLPVYEPGDSGSNRLEAFRVQTASGPGFVPLAAVDEADRPYLRVQTSSGVRAVDTSASGIPDSGVMRLTFNNEDTDSGTSFDSWGDNDGNINGATTGITGANQTYDTAEAYSFTTDDYVVVPNSTALQLGTAATIAFWVYLDDTANYGFVSKQDAGGSFTNDHWTTELNPSGPNPRFFVERGNTDNRAEADVSLNSQQWYHIIIAIDYGTEVHFYVDGSSTGKTSTISTWGTSLDVSDDLWIGQEKDFGRALEGDMDDVRIYDKVLSSTEASNLYNTGSIGG